MLNYIDQFKLVLASSIAGVDKTANQLARFLKHVLDLVVEVFLVCRFFTAHNKKLVAFR